MNLVNILIHKNIKYNYSEQKKKNELKWKIRISIYNKSIRNYF